MISSDTFVSTVCYVLSLNTFVFFKMEVYDLDIKIRVRLTFRNNASFSMQQKRKGKYEFSRSLTDSSLGSPNNLFPPHKIVIVRA